MEVKPCEEFQTENPTFRFLKSQMLVIVRPFRAKEMRRARVFDEVIACGTHSSECWLRKGIQVLPDAHDHPSDGIE